MAYQWSNHNELPARFVDYKSFCKWHVVISIEEVKPLFRDKKPFSLDTETTGLNPEESNNVEE